MSTLQNQRWSCRFSLLVGILLISLVPARVVAQSRTQPLEPGATQANLEIGPVEGLTTVWHEAPTETAVPLGTIVQFRIPNNRGAAVFWQGAQEVQRLGPRSVAEARFLAEGTHTVSVRYKNQRDEWIEESSVFEVIDTSFQPVRVSGLRVSAEPMELDEDDPNGSSMRYFFQDSSIAQVNEVAPGHYRTSVSRWVQLQVEVEPAAFSPLIEWRLDGAPQRHLGSGIRLQSFVTGMQTLSAGPRAGGATAELETYRVRVIPSNGGGRFVDGVPTAFRVETDPPGYEDEVTWLASTKYGTCSPPLGQGAEFETVFLGTAGAEGRWLGVKADHAKLATDAKGAEGPLMVDFDPAFRERMVLPVQRYVQAPVRNAENPGEAAGMLAGALTDHIKATVPLDAEPPPVEDLVRTAFNRVDTWSGQCICCCPQDCPCDFINDLIQGTRQEEDLVEVVLQASRLNLTPEEVSQAASEVLGSGDIERFDLYFGELVETVDRYASGEISYGTAVAEMQAVETILITEPGAVADLLLPVFSTVRHVEFGFLASCEPGAVSASSTEKICTGVAIVGIIAGAAIRGAAVGSSGGLLGVGVGAAIGGVVAGVGCVLGREVF